MKIDILIGKDMAGMWRIKKDGKIRRMMAACLGICMVMQIVIGGLLPIGTYAGDGRPEEVNISITEKQIRKALANKEPVEEWDDINLKIPYQLKEKQEAARELLESTLLRMTVVTKKTSSDYSYIVAAMSDDPENPEAPVNEIVLVGLNGKRSGDINFNLQITDENGMVIRSLTAIGYRWDDDSEEDGEKATESEATGSEADESPRATGSEADEPSMATDSEADEQAVTAFAYTAASGSEATESEVKEDGSDKSAGGFIEVYREVMEGDELEGLLISKAERPTALSLDFRKADSLPSAPSIRTSAGGLALGSVSSGAPVYNGTVGEIVNFQVVARNNPVKTGEYNVFDVVAAYSNAAANEDAILGIEFTVDGINDDDNSKLNQYLLGPETGSGVQEVSASESGWEKIQAVLKEAGRYEAGQKWYKIPSVQSVIYYCPETRYAAFSKANGDTASMALQFVFKSGITPDGVTITAKPEVVNEDALIQSYLDSLTETPGNSKPSSEEVKEGIKCSEPAAIENTAAFAWRPVTKEIVQSTLQGTQVNGKKTLGNLWTVTGDNKIEYTVTAGPDHGADTTLGVLNTGKIVLKDTVTFTGMKIAEDRVLETKKEGTTYRINLTKGGDTRYFMEFGFEGPEPANFTAEMSDDRKSVTFTLEYENPTPEQELQLNHNKPLSVKLNFYKLFRLGGIIQVTGDSETPSIKNDVELDTYAVTYDQASETDKKSLHHHSTAEAHVSATPAYPIIKTAFVDEECTKKAEGEQAVFNPEGTVYYQIKVKNQGYTAKEFKITDYVPDGIDFDSVEAVKAVIGADAIKINQLTVDKKKGQLYSWGNFAIPANQEATLTLKAKIKESEAFEGKDASSTKLENRAEWLYAEEGAEPLGMDSATVYVAAGELTNAELGLEKISSAKEGEGAAPPQLSLGATVDYTLTAHLTDKAEYSRPVTITDNWPKESVKFTQVKNLAPGGTVVLKTGTVEASYTNESSTTQKTVNVSSFKTAEGKTLTDAQISAIDTIKVIVYLDKPSGSDKTGPKVATVLSGTIIKEGAVTNSASGGSGEGLNPSVTFYAVNMGIEKKAYRIAKAYASNITETTALQQGSAGSATFAADDVVCFEIKVDNKNKAGANSLAIAPVLSDDLGGLFKDSSGKDIAPVFAEAVLKEIKGSIFYKMSDSWTWVPLDPPEDGNFKLDFSNVNGKRVEIPNGQSCTVRIYMKVPADAVKRGATRKFTNNASAVLTLDNQKFTVSSTVDINTLENAEQKVSISKEVYAVGKQLTRPSTENATDKVFLENAAWFNREIPDRGYKGYEPDTEYPAVNKGDYVLYKITIKNDSDTEPLYIYEIQDILPAEMEFTHFIEFIGGVGEKGKIQADSDNRLQLSYTHYVYPFTSTGGRWLYYTDGNNSDKGVIPSINFQKRTEGNPNGKMYLNGSVLRARLYRASGSANVPVIKKGGTIVYGILARVKEDIDSNTLLTNTTGVVVDQSAEIVSGDKVETTEQGWGDVAGTTVGGYAYPAESFKIVSASASVKGSDFTPGISKVCIGYRDLGAGVDTDWPALAPNTTPTDWLRWKITLHNGTNGTPTAGPIENYMVIDEFPQGMAYNGDDPAVFLLAGGKKLELPKPDTSKEGRAAWSITKDKETGNYTVTGAAGEKVETDEDLSIPVGGTLAIRVGTKPASADGTLRYGSYVNQAYLIPDSEIYSYKSACIGTVVQEPEKAINAAAPIELYGGAQTESWKTITASYDGNTELGDGRDDNHNTVRSAAGGEVTYTLYVKNMTGDGTMDSLVVVDHLPETGDRGLVNNAARQSDFAVTFADGTVTAMIQKADGDDWKTIPKESYHVSFNNWDEVAGSSESALAQTGWDESKVKAWSGSYRESDTLGVVFESEWLKENLKNDDIISVSFKGKMPAKYEDGKTGTPIAWNSFGYAYKARGLNLLVEPAKVGVRIPMSQLVIGKEVDSPAEGDREKEFSFRLEYLDGKTWQPMRDAAYTLISGGTTEENKITGSSGTDEGVFYLKHAQKARFYVPAGRKYRVTELDAEGFVVKTKEFSTSDNVQFNTGAAFSSDTKPQVEMKDKTEDGLVYHTAFKNTKASLVLPETGGMGTGTTRSLGAAMMLFATVLFFLYAIAERERKERKKER